MHRILGDLWSVSNPYQAVPWKGRGEGRGEKERGGGEKHTLHNTTFPTVLEVSQGPAWLL